MKIFNLIIFILTNLLYSSTRGDVKIIEATENIQYLSQKIATDYFSFYIKSEDILLKKQLNQNIDNLIFYITDIENTTQDVHTKNILDFFIYRIEQIRRLPNKKISKSNAKLILKYSEVLLEGAKSIAREHKYRFSKEEKMLMVTKEIQYLIERAIKYYMAFQVGLYTDNNYEQMKKAISDVDNNIQEIMSYEYPHELKTKLVRFNRVWKINRVFLMKANKNPIPYLLLSSTEYIRILIKDIEQFHKKNL